MAAASLRLEAADPLALVVVLIHDRAVVASGQNPERPLLGVAVEHVGAGRAGAVVGVRPERDVLVPLHLVAALRPFEVELGLVEFHVRADEIGDGVRQRRVGARRVFPVGGMMIVHARKPPQARVLAGVALVDVPDVVRLGDAAALVHHLVGGAAQPLDPAVGQEFLEQDVAVLEIELALLLRQHARLDGKDVLRRHGALPWPRAVPADAPPDWRSLIYHRYTDTAAQVNDTGPTAGAQSEPLTTGAPAESLGTSAGDPE